MIRPEDNQKVIMAGLAVIASLVLIANTAAAADMATNVGNATTETNLSTTVATPSPTLEDKATKVAKSVSKAIYSADEALSPLELKLVLFHVGFRGKALKEAWAISMRESTGRPMAHNTNASTGDNSYGLFQINMIGDLGPIRQSKYNLKSYNDLLDPVVNATVAFQMSAGGSDWSSWKGMNSGARQWLDNYPVENVK